MAKYRDFDGFDFGPRFDERPNYLVPLNTSEGRPGAFGSESAVLDIRSTFRSSDSFQFASDSFDKHPNDVVDYAIGPDAYVLNNTRWGSNQAGVGATVTWAFATANPSGLPARYSGYHDYTFQIPDSYRDEVRAAFNAWDAVSGITFVEVTDWDGVSSNIPNIRLGQDYIDGAGTSSGNTLADCIRWFTNNSPFSTLNAAQIRMDEHTFTLDPATIYQTILHEIGHAIGLGHATSPNEIMYPYSNSQNQDGVLDPQDIAGIQAIYGTGSTPPTGDAGNTFATAMNSNLPTFWTGAVGSGGDTDDFFKFVPTRDGTLLATLFGLAADLDLKLYNASQLQIAISERGGTLNDQFQINLFAGQTYYIRVDPFNTASSDYSLQLAYFTEVGDTTTLRAPSANVHGRGGNDNITGSAGADSIYGDAGADRLLGGGGNDTLVGGAAGDTLSGGAGADKLFGDAGKETLTGGSGADKFIFTAMNTANADIVADFAHGVDKIQLQNSVFTALTVTGTLGAAAFWTGANAHDANDRIIYNANNGQLFYDRDGTGAAVKVLIATLDTHLGLTNTDFQVI